MNKLRLEPRGRALRLDYLKRSLIESGASRTLIERDGLKGVASNHSIFETAAGETDEYANALKQFQTPADRGISPIYEHLAITDIRAAAETMQIGVDRIRPHRRQHLSSTDESGAPLRGVRRQPQAARSGGEGGGHSRHVACRGGEGAQAKPRAVWMTLPAGRVTEKIGLRALARGIHTYPTQAEAIKMAAAADNHPRFTPILKFLTGRLLAW